MEKNDGISIGMWVGILILLAIPIVGLITLIILVGNEDTILSNFAKASLILMLLGFVLTLLLAGCGMIF